VAALLNLLEHKRVDGDHMVLQHVQRKHANLVILTTIAEEFPTPHEGHEIGCAVPLLKL
jgi:hypothetical protein